MKIKLYNSKNFREIVDFAKKVEDEDMKTKLSELLRSYNFMYVKFTALIKLQDDRKYIYEQLDQLKQENDTLKKQLQSKERMIKRFQEHLKKDK